MAGVVPGKHRKQYWFWKRLKKLVCADIGQPLNHTTKVDIFFDRWLYGWQRKHWVIGDLLWPSFQILNAKGPITYSPPRFIPLFFSWWTHIFGTSTATLSSTLRRITTHFSRITTCGICSAIYILRSNIKHTDKAYAEKELKCQYAFCNSTSKHICLE